MWSHGGFHQSFALKTFPRQEGRDSWIASKIAKLLAAPSRINPVDLCSERSRKLKTSNGNWKLVLAKFGYITPKIRQETS